MKLKASIEGAALIMAITCACVLAGLGGTTYYVLQSKYRVVHQAASWDEALLSAEAGIEMAMNEIRRDLRDDAGAWQGWSASATPIDGSSAGQTPGATEEEMTYKFTSQTILRQGEGGQRSWAEVSVDAPLFLQDRTGEQWFRIRSLGVAEVPGGSIAAGEKQDLRLRKFDLRWNRRTQRPVVGGRPQTGRLIEAVAKPVGAFRLALLGVNGINLNNHNIVVDSYDSRDPEKSRNGGYPFTDMTTDGTKLKRQENGDIATNGQLIQAGNAHVHGDALTNGGTVLNSSNVTGEIRDDFFQEVITVKQPTTPPDDGTPTAINHQSVVLTAKANSPSSYVFSALNLSGQNILKVEGAADGSPTYCQIVVTGNISLSGQSQIQLGTNVYARIFVVGDASVSGNGFSNPNSPLHLQFYGCNRPKNADGTIAYGNISISGNGGFCGAVYAPNYNIAMAGGGSTDNIFGAFVGNNVSMTGVQAVHYDEALAEGGLISDFKIVSWFEDER
ncbi:MAG TPA: hypothetical protein VF614_06125 [Chthoniobacteraceae bacterium]